LPPRCGFDARHCSLADNPDLSAALRIRETDTMVSSADPTALQPQHFHTTKPRQQHQSDGGEAGRVFALSGQVPHNLPEVPKFVAAQPSLATLDRKLSNALRWVLADNVQPSRVTKKASQRSDCAARNPAAASRLAASSCLPASCRFARGDIGLHPLDVP